MFGKFDIIIMHLSCSLICEDQKKNLRATLAWIGWIIISDLKYIEKIKHQKDGREGNESKNGKMNNENELFQ